MKRSVRKLRLTAETVRHLRMVDLERPQGGLVAATDECPSEPTYCAKYCGD